MGWLTTDTDVRSGNKVCVLGATPARELLDETEREITAILRQKHRIHDDFGDSDDFSTFLLTESLKNTQNVINVMSIMLSLVAGISLVIGGIGMWFSGVVVIIFGLWPAWRASRLDPI